MLKSFVCAVAALAVTPCLADLPLDIEDLITEKNEAILEFDIGYFNYNTGLSSTNRLTSSLGYRYGIGANTELYGSISASASDRQGTASLYARSSSMAWDELRIGVNHRFSSDNDTPAFLGFADVVAAENTSQGGDELVYGKTWRIGFTAYRKIDPIVLSLTSSYRHSEERFVNGSYFDPGETFSLFPSLGFAINHKVSVTGGVHFAFQEKNELNGRDVGIRNSQTSLAFGAAFAFSEKTNVHFTVQAPISGNDGSYAGLSIIRKL